MNKVFFDSNILIYLYSSTETTKKTEIENLIQQNDDIFISTQVLFEFAHVTHRKLKIPYEEIEKALNEFSITFNISTITYDMLNKALKIASKYKYSFPDSLILTSAQELDCSILYSEDMHNNHIVEKSLKIINPFK